MLLWNLLSIYGGVVIVNPQEFAVWSDQSIHQVDKVYAGVSHDQLKRMIQVAPVYENHYPFPLLRHQPVPEKSGGSAFRPPAGVNESGFDSANPEG